MKNSCLIYAHRGNSSEYLENTRSAFDSAVAIGADGIETDVQLSRDRISVLWHDEHLGKIGCPKLRVGELDFDRLNQLNLADYGKIDGNEGGLVRLNEFVANYCDRASLILEVKNLEWDRNTPRHRINIEECFNTVKRFAKASSRKKLVISSFDLASLVHAHAKDPNQALVYNLDDHFKLDQLKRALDAHAFFQGYCLPIGDLNDQVRQLLCEYRKSLIVYTCNTPDQIRKAFDMEVDVLISDVPKRALDLRG